MLRGWLGGPLRGMAEIYVPFRLYWVDIRNGRREDTRLYGLDSFSGMLDLFGFDALPQAADLTPVRSRNCLPERLDETTADRLLLEKVRRLLFLGGFFRLRDLSLRSRPAGLQLHMPYWVGFYGREEQARMRVLDAVRRTFEGGKAQEIVRTWLAEAPSR
jgi:hypothetical protein